MTSEAWLWESKYLEQEVIMTSINENVPSMYTSTLMYETTTILWEEEEKKIMDVVHDNNNIDDNNKYQIEKVSAKILNNKKTIAALAIAGTVAVVAVGVSVGVRSFGDVEATMGNIPILFILGGGGGGLYIYIEGDGIDIEGDCCEDDCGDCDCDCDCGDCLIM